MNNTDIRETTINSIDLDQLKGAIFTTDYKHRLALWRVWKPNWPKLLFIGLNPSLASQTADDPTITRLIRRASDAGFGGLLVGNLFSLVSPEPGLLLTNPVPYLTPQTDEYIKAMIDLSDVQLCGWGSFTPVKSRAPKIYSLLPNPHCLAVNLDGEPRHPLYNAYAEPMVKYERENGR